MASDNMNVATFKNTYTEFKEANLSDRGKMATKVVKKGINTSLQSIGKALPCRTTDIKKDEDESAVRKMYWADAAGHALAGVLCFIDPIVGNSLLGIAGIGKSIWGKITGKSLGNHLQVSGARSTIAATGAFCSMSLPPVIRNFAGAAFHAYASIESVRHATQGKLKKETPNTYEAGNIVGQYAGKRIKSGFNKVSEVIQKKLEE